MPGTLDEFGRSDLHYAARDSDAGATRLLIAANSDVNLADNGGWTPLHFAAQAQSVAVARLVLDAGALVDPQDQNGNTPLSNATFESRGNGAMIQLLREAGADPFLENASGVSPLNLARSFGNFDVAQFYADLP